MTTLRQGETYPIYIELLQDGYQLTPDMIDDLKVCIGEDYNKTYKGGGVLFDEDMGLWWVHPLQSETLSMEVGIKRVCCHVKYHDGNVLVRDIDRINVKQACCKEVF